VAAWSKASACDRSFAGIAGSNRVLMSPVSVVCCQVEVSVSDHLFRGVLPSVVRLRA